MNKTNKQKRAIFLHISIPYWKQKAAFLGGQDNRITVEAEGGKLYFGKGASGLSELRLQIAQVRCPEDPKAMTVAEALSHLPSGRRWALEGAGRRSLGRTPLSSFMLESR